jgi:DNA polymerase III alpha subunit
MFNINNFEDEAVWDLICDGKTKGVFQLESSLGKHWAKQVKPRNIN